MCEHVSMDMCVSECVLGLGCVCVLGLGCVCVCVCVELGVDAVPSPPHPYFDILIPAPQGVAFVVNRLLEI